MYNISSWGADHSFRELVSLYDEDDLVKPELQRKYVWEKPEASRFIDSILLGLPIPSIFLAKTEDNKMPIIDGYQRLMTVNDYAKGIWSGDNSLFTLSNIPGKINQRWKGKAYNQLSKSEQRKIKTTTIHAIIFEQKKPKDKITSNPIDLKDLNKAEVFKAGFKEFLKKEQLSIEIEVPNKYETILTGNLYTNHYFNISTDFPDNWKRDRGMSEFSVIRVFIEDSAMVIALIAIPANFKNTTLEESHKNFQSSPFAAMELAL